MLNFHCFQSNNSIFKVSFFITYKISAILNNFLFNKQNGWLLYYKATAAIKIEVYSLIIIVPDVYRDISL